MPIRQEQKQQIVQEVNAAAAAAMSAVLADYRGVAVEDMTRLRRDARANKVTLRVVRNTLLRRAVADTEFECITEALTGPTLLALSEEDPGAAARLLKAFAADHEHFSIKALSVGGRLLQAQDIDKLANLPSREQALAMLMGTMLAPVAALARALADIPGRTVRTLAAVRDQKRETK